MKARSTPDLPAIRQRAEQATKGPWTSWQAGNCTMEDGLLSAIAEVKGLPRPWEPTWVGWKTAKNFFKTFLRSADADFIAHARQDIPDLLAYIETLTTERDKAISDIKVMVLTDERIRRCWDEALERQHKLEARIETLEQEKADVDAAHFEEMMHAAVEDYTALRASLSALVETWRRANEANPRVSVTCNYFADQLALILTGEK